MRLKGAAVGVIVLMLAALSPLPAVAGAQVGTLIGVLVRPAGHGQGAKRADPKQQPPAVHVVLTGASGHKRRVAVGHAGRFSARLPAGHYDICDTTSSACSGPGCPIELVGTRFGPTRHSPPVSTIVILPGLKTHVQVTCPPDP